MVEVDYPFGIYVVPPPTITMSSNSKHTTLANEHIDRLERFRERCERRAERLNLNPRRLTPDEDRERDRQLTKLRSMMREEKSRRGFTQASGFQWKNFRYPVSQDEIPVVELPGVHFPNADWRPMPCRGHWIMATMDGKEWHPIFCNPLMEFTIKELRALCHRPRVDPEHPRRQIATFEFPPDTPTQLIREVVNQEPDKVFDGLTSVSKYSHRYWRENQTMEESDTAWLREMMSENERYAKCKSNGFPCHYSQDAQDHSRDHSRYPFSRIQRLHQKLGGHAECVFRAQQTEFSHEPYKCICLGPTRWERKMAELQDVVERFKAKTRGEAQFAINFNLLSSQTVIDLAKQAEPLLQEFSEKLEQMKTTGQWANVSLQAFFAFCHMWQADWSTASIFTSITQFLMSLPVLSAVRNKLVEWSLDFISKFVSQSPSPPPTLLNSL